MQKRNGMCPTKFSLAMWAIKSVRRSCRPQIILLAFASGQVVICNPGIVTKDIMRKFILMIAPTKGDNYL